MYGRFHFTNSDIQFDYAQKFESFMHSCILGLDRGDIRICVKLLSLKDFNMFEIIQGGETFRTRCMKDLM
jgi:hypothetical protein